jgi:hypothetical protein
MKVLIIFVAAVWAALTPPAIAAARSDPQQLATDWRAHPPQRDAVFKARQEMGPDAFMQTVTALNQKAFAEMGFRPSGPIASCRFPQWFMDLSPVINQAQMVTDEAAWRSGWERIDAAIAARAALHADLLAGGKGDGIYGSVATRVASNTSPDAFVREVERRVIQDQMGREDQRAAMQRLDWARGLQPEDMTYVMSALAADLCPIDRGNTAWLKEVVAQRGWPSITAIGEKASGDLWLLVQHADQDVAFQKDVLALLQPMVARHEVGADNYAYLYDRVARAEGRPQFYGTQGHCTGPGQWAPYASEDPDGLDQRRAAMGLIPEAQYRTHFTYCTAAQD